jgi:DNA segregation ATPase FtsK/SpoIIIE-like protein
MRLRLEQEPRIGRAAGRIAVDIERPQREYVPFGSLSTALAAEKRAGRKSRVLAGVDLMGTVHFVDLARDAPHLLVGGVPGGGKSEWLRSAVASLLVTNTPDTLRLVLVDPKKNAFAELTRSEYLWQADSLVDSPEGNTIPLLESLIEEMQRRYELFKRERADDLAHYAAKTGAAPPRLVCVVDEFADLLMGGKRGERDEIERGFIRIAQMGRAAGVHLILATQRPSRQVVSGVLKANIPGKIAFRVANRVESGVLLDQGGAQNLLGKGDLLLSAGSYDLLRLQSAYMSEDERRSAFGGAHAVST